MLRLLTLTLLLSYLTICLADDLNLIPAPPLTRTRFLYPRYNITGTGPEDYECISARSSDYYGIGVRLGLYFSWWTAWAAGASMPDEISTALDQNTVFLFANVVALVRCTITFVLTQLDGLILMHLAMGTIIGVMSSWGYRTCAYQKEGVSAMKHFGGAGTHLRVLCNLGTCIYGAWYWNVGIRPGTLHMEADTNSCRTVWTFMFGKVNAAGPIRIFYLVFTILWIIHFGITLFAAPIADWIRFRQISKTSFPIGNHLPKDLRLATGLNYRQLRYLFQFLRVISAFWLCWSMLTIEMTLNYNHVKKVLGPGGRIYFPSQLIPMILGGFTLTRVVWKKFVQWRNGTTSTGMPAEQGAPPTPKSPTSPVSEKGVSTARNLMTLMSPPSPVVKKEEAPKFEDKDIDSRMLSVGLGWRMLVTYLPWLSLLPRFRHDNQPTDTAATSTYEPANDPENTAFWDQETPAASPDPRSNGTFQTAPPVKSNAFLPLPMPFSRNRNKFTIDRFENTIS